ncbi:HAMP domain-containing protein [Marinagarivorans cellulosilyticus]|uniref:Two-component system, chemotaxis family, sensor kinase CheA n=1 Tax=Marinagarivorans cellulosilyticus TaxID=2721545 RepID=A0AAN1WK82_9GAMM|nr:HAMP domain-containing protein [Marinagarivorans cellulosilyticus]BCD99042.1 two-component system, chemotaxis family, sensor kinase CheA [Marinagarivorans cellulosilyticus]
MKIFSGISVRWKIYFIAIVSIIGFGGYLAFNVWINTQNTALLTSVRDTYFPILEKSTSNGVRLERMSELFNTAVLTGELEYLKSAEATADTMREDFETILALEPTKKKSITDIQENFENYFNAAKAIAEEMATGEADFSTIGARVKNKEAYLELLVTQLETFRAYSHSNFSGNIDNANHNSELMLTSGFVIWVSSILVLTLTVYTIARLILGSIVSVSKSLHHIAQSGDIAQNIPVTSRDEIGRLTQSFNELMDKLRERTNDLMSMMHNMHQGLFTITEHETIHKEYSSYIEQIFSTTEVADQPYSTLLFSKANIGSDQMDQIKTAVSSLLGADEMMFAFNQHLLINEYVIKKEDAPAQIIELDWDPIITDGYISKIMVTVRDVTELRAMQAEAEEQKKELEIVGQIIRLVPAKFTGFISNARSLLDKNKSIIAATNEKNAGVIANLFVNMHTIKGNARTYQFSAITDVVHEAETTYDQLRKDPAQAWDPKRLLEELETVRQAIELYDRVRSEKLAASNANEIPEDSVILSQQDYQTLLKQSGNNDVSAVTRLLRRLDTLTLQEALGDLLGSLPSVAAQLDKPAPKLDLQLRGLLLHKGYNELINNVFTHLLRNAIDHGIESAEERLAQQKPAAGTIHLHADVQAHSNTLLLWDDGRGLNLKRLKEKAIKAGHLNPDAIRSASSIADCLFMSGVSTAEQVTAISGRGVGMDAVKTYLQNAGCDIEIILDESALSTDDFAAFKLKVTLANQLCEIDADKVA